MPVPVARVPSTAASARVHSRGALEPTPAARIAPYASPKRCVYAKLWLHTPKPRTANKCLLQERIHMHAYLSIGVTSGYRDGAVRGAWRGAFRGIGAPLSRILQMNFAEFLFRDCMKSPDRHRTGSPPSAQNGLRGHYFGVWCYRRPTTGAFSNYFSYSLYTEFSEVHSHRGCAVQTALIWSLNH